MAIERLEIGSLYRICRAPVENSKNYILWKYRGPNEHPLETQTHRLSIDDLVIFIGPEKDKIRIKRDKFLFLSGRIIVYDVIAYYNELLRCLDLVS